MREVCGDGASVCFPWSDRLVDLNDWKREQLLVTTVRILGPTLGTVPYVRCRAKATTGRSADRAVRKWEMWNLTSLTREEM